MPGEKGTASEKKKGDHYDTYDFTIKSVTLFDDSNRFAWITLPDNRKQMLQTVYTGSIRCTTGKGRIYETNAIPFSDCKSLLQRKRESAGFCTKNAVGL